MSKKRSRRRFTAEFKAETVKLVKQSDRTMSAIATELGISAKSVIAGTGLESQQLRNRCAGCDVEARVGTLGPMNTSW